MAQRWYNSTRQVRWYTQWYDVSSELSLTVHHDMTTMAQRQDGIMGRAQWYHEAQWYHGTMARWPKAQWHRGMMVQWYHGTKVQGQRHSGNIVGRHDGQWHNGTLYDKAL